MKKTKKEKAKEILKSPEGKDFIDRLANLLFQQVELESLVNTGPNRNETRKVRQSK